MINSVNGRTFWLQDTTSIIEGDSQDYDILISSAKHTANLMSPTVELGVRYGLGSILIMEEDCMNKTHICVDPYGDIEYNTSETNKQFALYSNDIKQKCLYALYKYAMEKNKNLLFFVMEDTEFFQRFADGVPLYERKKLIVNNYSLVLVDGQHKLESVENAADFFIPKMETNGIIIFDDIETYNHDHIEKKLMTNSFSIFEKGSRKAAYKKI